MYVLQILSYLLLFTNLVSQPVTGINSSTDSLDEIKESYPFVLGEKLYYKMNYSFFTVGKAEIRIYPVEYTISRTDCYKIDIYGQTAGAGRLVSRVNDNFGAYITTENLLPLKSWRILEEGRYRLKEYVDLEKNLVSKRAWYLKRARKILSPTKILRWAQLENRMDLTLRLQLASVIPLAPIEGELTGSATQATAIEPGVPGGIVVQTHELTATVAKIDKATRKLTLVSPDGIKQTVKVGPKAINFDQIRLGDQLKVTVAEELVVYVASEGENPGDAAAQSASAVRLFLFGLIFFGISINWISINLYIFANCA